MKITIELDTATNDRIDFVKAANSILAAASLATLRKGFTCDVGLAVYEDLERASGPDTEQKPEPAKQTRAPRQTKAAEQPAPAEPAPAQPAPEPTPAPTEQPVQTVAITRDEIKALGTKITQAHGAPAISAVGGLFKSFVDAEGNPARLSTVREADFPALVAKMQAALAKPAGTPVDQLFA